MSNFIIYNFREKILDFTIIPIENSDFDILSDNRFKDII